MVRAAEGDAVAVRIAALCQRAHVVRRTRSVGVLQLARRSNPREGGAAASDDWEQRGVRAAAARPRYRHEAVAALATATAAPSCSPGGCNPVSYTHLTLPTNREV